MIPTRVSALAIAAALGFATVSFAQPAPPAQPQPGMSTHHWSHDDASGDHAMHAAAHVRALHDALNIRPDQEGAFQAFATNMMPRNHEGMDHRHGMYMSDAAGRGVEGPTPDRDKGVPAPVTAPERADQMVKRFDDHAGRMREAMVRRAQAVKTFYAVLSPEQRHTLDALSTLMGRQGGHMEGMGRGMRPMGGMPEHEMGPGQAG